MDVGYKLRTKPITTPKKTPESSQIRDTFETPKYATELLLPFIPRNVNCVWEPAAGNCRISKVIKNAGIDVLSSDIRILTDSVTYYNFLTDTKRTDIHRDCAIITNPPFSVKEQFIEKAFEYGVPFAFLINADYSQQAISWMERGCEKIVPNRRINFITPNILNRIHEGEVYKKSTYKCSLNDFKKDYPKVWEELLLEFSSVHNYNSVNEVPSKLLYAYSSSQFHSIWLTYGFKLGKTETFVDVDLDYAKENMI